MEGDVLTEPYYVLRVTLSESVTVCLSSCHRLLLVTKKME